MRTADQRLLTRVIGHGSCDAVTCASSTWGHEIASSNPAGLTRKTFSDAYDPWPGHPFGMNKRPVAWPPRVPPLTLLGEQSA